MSKNYEKAFEDSIQRLVAVSGLKTIPKTVVILFAKNLLDNGLGGEWKALFWYFKQVVRMKFSIKWSGFTFRLDRFWNLKILRRSTLDFARKHEMAHVCNDCKIEYEDFGTPGITVCDDCFEDICNSCMEFHACELVEQVLQ